MWFWSFSLPFTGAVIAIAMTALPLSIGFSFSRTALSRLPRTNLISKISMYPDFIDGSQESDVRWINPNAIKESSLRLQGFIDRDGIITEVFSANTVNTTTKEETIWWQTSNINVDSNPYEELEYVWTDERFPRALLSWRADKNIGSWRKVALGWKHFAYLMFRCISDFPTVVRKRCLELHPRVRLQASVYQPTRPVQQLASIAFISLFLGVGPLRLSFRNLWRDIFAEGLLKNRCYLLSMPISLLCVSLIRAFSIGKLKQKWALTTKSPLVEHLTTLSITLQSLGIFTSVIKGLVITLLRLPILAFLNVLSTARKWWQSKGGNPRHSRLDAIMARLVYGRIGSDDSYPIWTHAIIFAPLWEELFYRFAFDKLWQGFFRGTSSVAVLDSSNILQSGWIWANSILFGLVHACNWFPSNQFDSMVGGEVDGSNERKQDYWDNLFSALSHSLSGFITAFFVLNPLYVRHGLSASICGHAIINCIGVALVKAAPYDEE